jgi:hypothetical protein
MDHKMNVKLNKLGRDLGEPARTLYAGELGYRAPLGIGEVDVWVKNKRLIYLGALAVPRVAWRLAVARRELGEAGRAADVRGRFPSYHIGELKRQGSQVQTRRRPGGDPVHAAGGLRLVDTLHPDDPRLTDPTWRPPRGCCLAVDVDQGAGWVYRMDRGRMQFKSALIRAFAYTAGPRVRVDGRPPVYQVHARQWTKDEAAARASATTRRVYRGRSGQGKAAARAAELAKVQAERERRKAITARVKTAAFKVDQLSIRLVDAETSLARWPDDKRQAKVDRYRVELARAWAEWLQVVRANSAILAGGRMPPAPHRDARRRAASRWADLVDQVAVRLAVLIVNQVRGDRGD